MGQKSFCSKFESSSDAKIYELSHGRPTGCGCFKQAQEAELPLSLICDTAYVLLLEQEREQWLRLLGKVEQPAWSEVQADFDAGLADDPRGGNLRLLRELGVA
jgi:hypothetical protein